MILKTEMKFHLTDIDHSHALWETLREVGESTYIPNLAPSPELKGGVDLHFFRWRGKAGATFADPYENTSFVALNEEYARRGLQPADVYTVCAANKADSSLMGKYQHLTIMKDLSDRWLLMSLYLYDHKLPHHSVERVINFRLDEEQCPKPIETFNFWFVGTLL